MIIEAKGLFKSNIQSSNKEVVESKLRVRIDRVKGPLKIQFKDSFL